MGFSWLTGYGHTSGVAAAEWFLFYFTPAQCCQGFLPGHTRGQSRFSQSSFHILCAKKRKLNWKGCEREVGRLNCRMRDSKCRVLFVSNTSVSFSAVGFNLSNIANDAERVTGYFYVLSLWYIKTLIVDPECPGKLFLMIFLAIFMCYCYFLFLCCYIT